MPEAKRPGLKRKGELAEKAAEEGVKSAQDVFPKVLAMADPKPAKNH